MRVGDGGEKTTGGFEGGFNGGGFGQVVVLLFGDEDIFTAAGFGRLIRIALVRHWHSLAFRHRPRNPRR